MKLISESPDASALDVGSVLEQFGHEKLSEGSRRRYGAGLLTWINWIRLKISASPRTAWFGGAAPSEKQGSTP